MTTSALIAHFGAHILQARADGFNHFADALETLLKQELAISPQP